MLFCSRTILLSGVAFAALAAVPAAAQEWVPAKPFARGYVAGDFHNHTPCADAQLSVQALIDRAVGTGGADKRQWNLDWFIHANHGGAGSGRDCRFTDPQAAGPTNDPLADVNPTTGTAVTTYFDQTLNTPYQGIIISAIKGDNASDNGHKVMWRWQSVQEVDYPLVIQRGQQWKKVVIEGLEQVVPGHEHIVSAVLGGVAKGSTGEFPGGGATGNASGMGYYEFVYDRADTDSSNASGWQAQKGAVLTAHGGTLANQNPANTGTAGHGKTVDGIAWLQANHPLDSYANPTHIERQGFFNPNGNNGANIEHFRDFNNAGPTVSFGIEGPGHAASPNRGSYGTGAVGNGTYGGRGIYNAQIGNLWDALLAEGRNWFFFGGSDYHTRGSFGPSDRYSTSDFAPGEYDRNYVPAKVQLRAQSIIDGLRSGNSFNTFGNLIGPDFLFRICNISRTTCKTQGETLVVAPGDSVVVDMTLTVPGSNNSPYSFPNPILKQVGVVQALNAPDLDHVDFIKGDITGVIAPGSADYTKPVNYDPTKAADRAALGWTNASAKFNPQNPPPAIALPASRLGNPYAALYKQVGRSGWQASGQQRTISFTIANVQGPFFLRARGTNLPNGTPNATDSTGAPLPENRTSANPTNATVNNSDPTASGTAYQATQEIICADVACPSHLPLSVSGSGNRVVDYDVRAWSSLWFYANPVFVRTTSNPKLLVETNVDLAKSLASN